MPRIATEAAGLRKLLKLARKEPLSFAFSPAPNDEDSLFSLDRKKAPTILGKAVKIESGGGKVAFGTAALDGKLLKLTCLKMVPGIAKKAKKSLRADRILLNVVILDRDGNVLEQEIEDLPDGTDDGLGPDEEGPVPVPAPQPGRPGVRSGETGGSPPQGPPPPDPRAGLRQALQTLAQRVRALPDGSAKARLLALVREAGGRIQAGETGAATAGLKRIRAALAALPGEATPPGSPPPPSGAAQRSGTNPEAPPPPPEDAGRDWEAARARLEPEVMRALGAGLGDTSRLRAVWSFATGKAEAGDFAAAMKAVPGLVELLRAAREAGRSEAGSRIPEDLVGYVRARLAWAATRRQLREEIARLRAAILATCTGEEFAGLARESEALFDHLDGLDDRLETVLETLVMTPDGPARERLKRQAARIVEEYRARLDTDFFRDVDSNNGFVTVGVRGPALAALRGVAEALAS